MKRTKIFIVFILLILTGQFIWAQPQTIIYEWKIRSDSWEGVDLKVLPSWRIYKGLDTLVITDDAFHFFAVISLRYEPRLDLDKLKSMLQNYEKDYIYKTIKTVPISPLMEMRGNYELGYYFVFEYKDNPPASTNKEYRYICRALWWLDDNLFLDVILLTNNIDTVDFKQFLFMLESSVPMFGR